MHYKEGRGFPDRPLGTLCVTDTDSGIGQCIGIGFAGLGIGFGFVFGFGICFGFGISINIQIEIVIDIHINIDIHIHNISPPPPSILGSRGALLRVNRDILQNATKQRKTSLCWLLKMYLAFDHRPFFQNF